MTPLGLLYGYLCHPSKTNTRLQTCVLCVHAIKDRWDTDEAELVRVKRWFEGETSKEALKAEYPDRDEPGNKGKGRVIQWKQ